MNSGVKTITIGMLGCGVVGSQVARLLQDDEQELSERSGALLKLSKVGVRTAGAREGIEASLITTDLQSIVSDPSINIIIEVKPFFTKHYFCVSKPAIVMISSNKDCFTKI